MSQKRSREQILDDLQYAIDHVFLPPQLPQMAEGDESTREKNVYLMGHVLEAARSHKPFFADEAEWQRIVKLLSTFKSLHSTQELSGDTFLDALGSMEEEDVLALHITKQNAGLIIRRHQDEVIFESFEVSLTNSAITNAEGRLKCSYPGPSISVSWNKVQSDGFQEQLGLFLVQMQSVAVSSDPGFSPTASSDPADPQFVTHMLTGILRAMGRAHEAFRITKHVRDEVLTDGSGAPWRRSPLWFVMKVSLQTSCGIQAQDPKFNEYKPFMLSVMSRFIRLAIQYKLPSDLIHIMNAKLGRRIMKLGMEFGEADAVIAAAATIDKAATLLESRWAKVQEESTPEARMNFNPDQFEDDTSTPQSTRSSILDKVGDFEATGDTRQTIKIPYSPARALNPNLLPLNKISLYPRPEQLIAAYDFEQWVSLNLDAWTDDRRGDDTACEELAESIDFYVAAAQPLYKDNPVQISIMLLTVMQLWVAIDTIAVDCHPLMCEFNPEFTSSMFRHLLLPERCQMERLNFVEAHVKKRWRVARQKFGGSSPRSVMSKQVDDYSFTVRYFDGSASLRELRNRIMEDALGLRATKKMELAEKNRKHADLMRRADGKECTCTYVRKRRQMVKNSTGCAPCSLRKQAEEMTIKVHEWPLPGEEMRSKAAVFEIRVPPAVAIWRDTTYKVLIDLMNPTKMQKTGVKYNLESFEGLDAYNPGSGGRLKMASSERPASLTNARGVRIPTTSDSVILDHAGVYRLCDSAKGLWILLGREQIYDLKALCTMTLPQGPYQCLQFAVDGTSHTQNQVIAKQAECPKDLSLHEFEAFGSLRSGNRLQLRNILRELRSRILNLNTEAVHTLLMQALWQVGPTGDSPSHRDSHIELADSTFGSSLMEVLNECFTHVQSNWQQRHTVESLIQIARRLLSMTTNEDIAMQCLSFLRRARSVSLDWTEQAYKTVRSETGVQNIQGLQWSALHLAALCRLTFDVDAEHAQEVLSEEQDIIDFIKCGVIIQNHKPPRAADLPQFLRILIDNSTIISCKLEVTLRTIVLERDGLFDLCIRGVWPAYGGGHTWSALDKPRDRWVTTQTQPGAGETRSLEVHFDLLENELRIEGTPNGRLPKEYLGHSVYHRVFGTRMLDTAPSTMTGMTFESRHLISGHRVFFDMKHSELTVCTRYEDRTYVLVPHVLLRGMFPSVLIDGYVHWMDTGSQDMEFRPLDSRWKPAENNWIFRSNPACLVQGSRRLIDIKSATAEIISNIFEPLDSREHIVIWLSSSGELNVELVRYKLEWYLNAAGGLESRNFRGMVVDTDQNIGAFYGLQNKLVMRPAITDSTTFRSVLIPHGKLNVLPSRGSHHHMIRIDVEANLVVGAVIRYHVMDINTRLGHLAEKDTMLSRFWKILLHAMTAHCLPDPLTGTTGIEEALSCLNSAGSYSFQSLTTSELEVLDLIRCMTPRREYHPFKAKTMQKVVWNKDLPFLNQSESLLPSVQGILEHWASIKIFGAEKSPTLKGVSENRMTLLRRAQLRTAVFGTEIGTSTTIATRRDDQYPSRHEINSQSPMEQAVYAASSLVLKWEPGSGFTIDARKSLGSTFDGPTKDAVLTYNHAWLHKSLQRGWATLYTLLRDCNPSEDIYAALFVLAALASRKDVDLDVVRMFLAYATIQDLRQPVYRLPAFSSCDLSQGAQPDTKRIEDAAKQCVVSYEDSQERHLPQRAEETASYLDIRRQAAYDRHKEKQIADVADYFASQWPNTELRSPSRSGYPLLDVDQLTTRCQSLFREWKRNKLILKLFKELQRRLGASQNETPCLPTRYRVRAEFPPDIWPLGAVSLSGLLEANAPNIAAPMANPNIRTSTQQTVQPSDITGLRMLCEKVDSHEETQFQATYRDDLSRSISALEGTTLPYIQTVDAQVLVQVKQYLCSCEQQSASIIDEIQGALGPHTLVERALHRSGLWPRTPLRTLLGVLATVNKHECPAEWRKALILLGENIAAKQRAQRLVDFGKKALSFEFWKELQNASRAQWTGSASPETLLLEIEANLRVRESQAKVGAAMISPATQSNSVMQLNMGEGKSSVIMPIAAATLADQSKLVRVVVPKPLARETFRLLSRSLAHTSINRRIYFLPFSRSLKVDYEMARQIRELFEECRENRGILLAQPEHILSFKLMGLERAFYEGDQSEVASELINTQLWLNQCSRDILDESDEILHCRYQMLYALGSQASLDGGSIRWTLIQEIMHLVKCHAVSVQARFPAGIEYEDLGASRFPTIRLLDQEASTALQELLVSDICCDKLSSLSFRLYSKSHRDCALRYILDPAACYEEQHILFKFCEAKGTPISSFLLLRGLFAHGLLLYALGQKRWRVEYGLDLKRSLLAVPYRAKDNPAPRADFGHPDVAILMTCLSYYYGGLTDNQLDTTLRLLLQRDDPGAVYDSWISQLTHVPETLRVIHGVNLEDLEQTRRDVYPLFRHNKAAIDFFLSSHVFPQAAKEFPLKLSTSAWDLAEVKRHPTTGFSGTNDNKYLLPLSISQKDSDEQLHTNALVLLYLLRSDNSSLVKAANVEGKRLKARALLSLLRLQQPPVRVLLDVGAQILERKNQELASDWLNIERDNPDIKAVVFFNAMDELTVLDRNGKAEPFLSSPFSQQMEYCLVYLDEAHTRGTDLKLPTGSRAVVTLGPKLTKDKLVQGCMRMRKLGNGHSVLFFAPPDVYHAIEQSSSEPRPPGPIATFDVLRWVMWESCYQSERNVSLWMRQGRKYYQNEMSWRAFKNDDNTSKSHLAESVVENDARALLDHYGILDEATSSNESDAPATAELQQLEDQAKFFGVTLAKDTCVEEEQERELCEEVEEEREVERPPQAEPMEHKLDPVVDSFVKSGRINANSPAFISAFKALENTSLAKLIDQPAWMGQLFVTNDFSRTVIIDQPDWSDQFLRPVNWIVSNNSDNPEKRIMVLISPFEANAYIRTLAKSKKTCLHMYAPRTSQAIPSFESMAFAYLTAPSSSPFLRLPETMIDQLNLFAGQTILLDFQAYNRVCGYLGLYLKSASETRQGVVVDSGFVKRPQQRRSLGMGACPFKEEPVTFLRELMTVRRKGQPYITSHMGRILSGRLMDEMNFVKQEEVEVEAFLEDVKMEDDEVNMEEDDVKMEEDGDEDEEDVDELEAESETSEDLEIHE